MNKECETPPCTEEQDEEELEYIETRNIDIDFGKVEIFKERTQYLEFQRPMINEDISYNIKRSASIRIIKANFEMEHYKGVSKPNEDFLLGVTYKPTLVSVKDHEVFEYSDTDGEIIKISLTGVAIGPHCHLSAKRLEFYITNEQRITQRKIEIINDSEASARFKIDLPHNDIFNIYPTEGTILANKYEYITIKFCPEKTGIFSRKLFILVWNAEPLILNLFAINGINVNLMKSALKYFNDSPFGFKSYLEDNNVFKKEQRPFKLSPSYIDFGRVKLNEKEPITQVTTFTNCMNCSIFVTWYINKNSKTFTLSPKTSKIKPNNYVQFEIQFNPEQSNNVYQEHFLAQIDWHIDGKPSPSQTPEIPVPLTCNFRVQGNSFLENEGWIVQVKILPEVIYWQPCSPGDVAYTSFLMRNLSHLPVLYKLIPPKQTNITAKPMMGKFRNTEIIIVQLQTEQEKVKTYVEEWKIIFNGREDQQFKIYFHGETCIPSIEIGKNNKINAGNVQEGSQKEIEVFMQNTSFYSIHFQFHLIKHSILQLAPMSGILPGNQFLKLNIKITGSECAPKQETFVCETRIIDGSGSVSGVSREINVDLYCQCSYSQLCACPSFKDCGRYQFGQKIKAEFQVINLGDTAVFFQTCQCGDELQDSNFRIKPYFGEVKPKDCKHISITGIISKLGDQTLNFGYYNRMVRDSPLVTGEPIRLFKLTYQSEFPIIQIEEIVKHNFGALFGKVDMYENYLEIPKINQILRELLNDQTVQLHLRLPEFEIQKTEFYINLALKNISDFDTKIELKRKKICNCELAEVSAGTSKRKKEFICPHRSSFSMSLEDTRFLANVTKFLSIKVNYNLPGDNEMCYILELSCNRIIELFFTIPSIQPETPKLSTFTRDFSFKLESVYLGTRVAPIQIFWLYNNTRHLLHFEFDVEDIKHMCKIDGFQVLEILNPIDHILPYKNKALLVKFHPIEEKAYLIKINVNYYFPTKKDKVWTNFLIIGEGVMKPEDRFNEVETMPKVCKFISDFPVTLSVDLINIKILPTWSKRKELIFIKNNSRGKILQCIWDTIKINDVIEISTQTNYTILRPKDIQPVVIIVKTFSQPCKAQFVLPCEIVSYSDALIYKIVKEKHQEAENRIDKYMLGEPKWAQRPKNPITVPPKPDIQYASVVINIKTVHIKDLDENMDVSMQLKQYPNQSMENIPKSLLKKYYPPENVPPYPKKDKEDPTFNLKESQIFCRILEEIISDVLFGDLLKNHLEKSIDAPMHKYNEFIMDDKQIAERKSMKSPLSNEDIEIFRKREIHNFFNQLKATDLSNILQGVIYESIVKIVQCHNPNTDIKELNEEIEKALHSCKNKCS